MIVNVDSANVIFLIGGLGTFCVVSPEIQIVKFTSTPHTGVGKLISMPPATIQFGSSSLLRNYRTIPEARVDISSLVNEVDAAYDNGIQQIRDILGMFPKDVQESLNPLSVAPHWQSYNWRWCEATDAIQQTQRWLKKVEKMLEGAKGVINKTRSILTIIKQFLSFFEDTLKKFLQTLVKMIERFLNDVKSTGIYFLDMTTYHFFSHTDDEMKSNPYIGPWWFPGFNDSSNENARHTSVFTGQFFKILGKGHWSDVSTEASRIGTPNTEGGYNYGNQQVQVAKGTAKAYAEDIFREVLAYKKETYKEFIEKICWHFTSPHDCLPSQLRFSGGRGTFNENRGFRGNRYNNLGNDFKNGIQEYSPWGVFYGNHGGLKNFRTGRPDFGPNGRMVVYIVAVAFPDISQLMKLMFALFGYRKRGDGSWTSSGSHGILGKICTDCADIVEKSSILWNQVWTQTIDSYGKNLFNLTSYVQRQRTGTEEYPYWVGLTLGNMFGFIWDTIDELLGYLKNLSFTVDRSIIDTIDGILRKIVNEIDNFTKIIQIIDQILEFINQLLSIPTFAILKIDVREGGTNEVVKQIRKAVGFFENAIDDTKDIMQIAAHIAANKEAQHASYTHYNLLMTNENMGVLGQTDNTVLYIQTMFNLWNARYLAIRAIYNKCIIEGLMGMIIEIEEQRAQYQRAKDNHDYWIGVRDMLIAQGVPPQDVAYAQTQIDYYQGVMATTMTSINNKKDDWDAEFDELRNIFYTQFPWPVTNDVLKTRITAIDVLNTQGYTGIRLDIEKDKITYNIKILTWINNGQSAFEQGIEKFYTMMDNFQLESLTIYDPNKSDSNPNPDKLRQYMKMMQVKANEANAYIILEMQKNKDLIENRLHSIQTFDPDNKYMFAGFVMVMGSPDPSNIDENYFNFDEFNKQVSSEYDELQRNLDEGIGQLGNSYKQLKKLFS